jgi:hypothetical protein
MRNLVLSVDKLNTHSSCPRRYYFHHVLNRESPEKPKYFLEGEFYHKCLEYYYRDKIKSRVQSIPFYLDIAANFATSFEGLDYSDFETLFKIFSEYLTYYENEDWTIENVEVPFAKILFEDKTADLRVIVRGKADLLITTKTGLKATVDHKLLARFEGNSERDNQILAYSWAFDRRDFFLNKSGKQTSYSPEKKFVRDYFCVSNENVEEWIETTIYASLEIARQFEKNYFPGKFTACNYKGHKCTFHDVCSRGQKNWEYMLTSQFSERKEFDLMNSGQENVE